MPYVHAICLAPAALFDHSSHIPVLAPFAMVASGPLLPELEEGVEGSSRYPRSHMSGSEEPRDPQVERGQQVTTLLWARSG